MVELEEKNSPVELEGEVENRIKKNPELREKFWKKNAIFEVGVKLRSSS